MRTWALGLFYCAAAVGAPNLAEWRDVAARIEYGFYTADARLIEGALPQLAVSAAPAARYLQGLASYRLARLAGRGTADEKAAVERCLAHAEPSEQHVLYAAEVAVLRAACLALARQSEPLKASLHERRLRQALARARSDDAANPRVALIEGQLALARMDFAAAATHLDNAVEFFATELDHGRELWGHAEALAILAYLHLRQGESRQARDLAEQALLIAPEYALAREVREQVLSAQSGMLQGLYE